MEFVDLYIDHWIFIAPTFMSGVKIGWKWSGVQMFSLKSTFSVTTIQ